jgi:DNA polymerase-3 subunit gamma/tau
VADDAPGPRNDRSSSSEPEPYQALYRQFRPQRFADVRGQDHVTRALLNAVRDGRVAHAYLFSGPRGTGKTSTARILAMALNCEAPVDGEPDGTCLSCLAIRSGASMDVFELDAASNRKLDEMRDLLSRVALGTPGRWKVYIIDEVHQLTSDAASALLKTLEGPPSHVVFVLATTDPQRVLDTILSRTQHFEFRLFTSDVLTGLVEDVNERAGLGLPPGVLQTAVRRGRGSARDALSALDQLATAGVAEDEVGTVAELVDALASRDVGAALQAVAECISSGKDPRRLGSELVEHLRNAFLALRAPSLVLLPTSASRRLADQANEMGLPFLVRTMETVGKALIDMRDSVDPRVTLEVALIRVASPGADTSPAALLERIEQLERRLWENGRPQPGAPALAATKSAGDPAAPGAQADQPSQAPQTPAPPGSRDVPGLGARPRGAGAGTQFDQPAQALQSGPAQARVALGAFLRDKPAGAPQPGLEGQAPAGTQPAGLAPAGTQPAGLAPAVTTPATQGSLPSRDELTKAWGDTVLAKLSKTARVYLANGRFVEPEGSCAEFALPDRNMLARAANYAGEARDALSTHFGRPVPLLLVLDRGTGPEPVPPGEAPDDAGPYDLSEISETAPVPDVPVEQRILQAFPGSFLHE